jgi:HlyD family secretion protein
MKNHIGKWAAILALMLIVAAALYRVIAGGSVLPEGLIQANGRIEGDHVIVSSKFAGRILELKVREGEAVTAGQIMAVLDDSQVTARVNQAKAAVAVLDAQVKATRSGLAVMRKEVPLAVDGAKAGLARAQAVAERSNATQIQSQREADRTRQLVSRGFIDRQRAEQNDLAVVAATAEHSSTRNAVTQAEKQLADPRLGEDRIGAKEAEFAALEAQREQAKAVLAETESVLADLTIKAPISGIVMTRVRDTGEVVNAGGPIFDLVDLDKLYLKVYVPESLIGKLRLTLPARIYTDAFPDLPFPATVKYISSRAEFTPKEVQTPDERVKLTYAVRLYLDKNPERKLTPGLPADAVIRWKEEIAWAKPRW